MKKNIWIIIFVLYPLICGCSMISEVAPDDIVYPELRFTFPKAHRLVLNNGIAVYHAEDHELPIVKVAAITRAGSYYDEKGKEGLTDIAGKVMRTGGTTLMNGDSIDEELDYIAGNVTINVHTDSLVAGLSVQKEDLDAGMRIYSNIIREPVFDERKLDVARELKIEDLRRIEDNPQRLAFREFGRIIYSGDPRGRAATSATVRTIARKELNLFHKRFFSPENMIMAVSGDITADETRAILERYFGKWKAGSKVEGPGPPVSRSGNSFNYIYKDIPQSIILAGFIVPGKTHKDHYAFAVLDFIMGSGGFRSRIFSEIRNNLGLAYSAGSFYSPRRDYGLLVSYSMTKAPSTIKAFAAMLSIIEGIRKNGITADELKWAKESINNNFVFSFTTAHEIALRHMELEFHDIPVEYIKEYRERIESVTLEDVKRVAAEYLEEKRRVVLILGNEKDFDTPLSNIADFKLVEPIAP